MSRRAFTIIWPYFENPGQLLRQFHNLTALPDDVKKCLHVIICDDGSPESPAEAVDRCVLKGVASFQMFRVDVDVRWNWLTCRNIGVHEARTQWVLMTDIDHELPEATARKIIEKKLSDRNVYRFSRRDAPDLTEYKPHPNSWLMTKGMFDLIGGYDERFSGHYGTDGEFRDRVRATAREVVMLDEYLIRVPREVQPDASTTRYGRKEPIDAEVSNIRARNIGSPPVRLSFPYHRVV